MVCSRLKNCVSVSPLVVGRAANHGRNLLCFVLYFAARGYSRILLLAVECDRADYFIVPVYKF